MYWVPPNQRVQPTSASSVFQVPLKECAMIGVIVTFRYGDNFDEQVVRKIAETARGKFEGMPGLRSKAFTFSFRKASGDELLCLGLGGRRQGALH